MAILQISRITQRKGLAQDLPEPLAGAELGWAVDTRQLFIGNGELTEGAPVVGNTEILTEFSDILNYATSYTYKGAAAGYIVQTGVTTGDPVAQSLQSRLDSYAIVTDFGATGDGVTDDTAAINRALEQLYCRQTNTQVRRSLFFPAGTYLITDTILIPPYAKLYGEGSNSSIISFQVYPFANSGGVGTIAYDVGILVSYSGSYYRSIAGVPIGVNISDTNYWESASLPSYVAQTTDSLQQSGASIGTNGAVTPQSVEVSGLSFQTINFSTTVAHNILLIDRADQVSFKDVTFAGPFTTTDGSSVTEDLACVRFGSSSELPCTQIYFDNCRFTGATFGLNADQLINGATISNSYFDVLFQGIVLDTDPTGVRMVHNTFDSVYNQGIQINAATFNMTAYNMFYDVGNQFNGITYPSTSIISINADNNICVGDMFQRTTAQAATATRIELNDTGSIAMGMNIRNINYTIDGTANTAIANQLELGKYTRTTGVPSVMNDNDSGTLFTVSSTAIKAFKMDYTITRSTTIRTGTIVIVSGTTFSFTDDYSENASTGITLSASEATNLVTVSYASTSTGSDATISYSITHLA